jgi:hypothetical protein
LFACQRKDAPAAADIPNDTVRADEVETIDGGAVTVEVGNMHFPSLMQHIERRIHTLLVLPAQIPYFT